MRAYKSDMFRVCFVQGGTSRLAYSFFLLVAYG